MKGAPFKRSSLEPSLDPLNPIKILLKVVLELLLDILEMLLEVLDLALVRDPVFLLVFSGFRVCVSV